jgi:hypothetical protein
MRATVYRYLIVGESGFILAWLKSRRALTLENEEVTG